MNIEKGMKETDQYEIEEGGLVDPDKVGVPGLEVLIVGRAVVGLSSVDVLLAVLDDLGQDLAGDVGKWDPIVRTIVLDHVLYRLRLQGHRLVHLERLAVRAFQCYLPL